MSIVYIYNVHIYRYFHIHKKILKSQLIKRVLQLYPITYSLNYVNLSYILQTVALNNNGTSSFARWEKHTV